MGHDLDDLEGQRSTSKIEVKAVLNSSHEAQGFEIECGEYVESVPTVIEGSSIIIGSNGKQSMVTVASCNEEHVTKESQLYSAMDDQDSVIQSSTFDKNEPLLRINQNQGDTNETENPSANTSFIQMPTKNPQKITRKFLTLKQRYDICKWHVENPNSSFDDVIDHFEPVLGRRLPRSTLSAVFTKSAEYLSVDPNSPSAWTRKKITGTDFN